MKDSITLDTMHTDTPNVLHAALHARCPKCREGNMFANKMYSLSGQKMNKTCPACNYTFEIEPGYFYVAMFVSYAFNVAQMVTLAIVTYVLTGSWNPWLYITVILGTAVILSPLNFRYSRVVLLYWLTPGLHYDPDRLKNFKKR